MNAGIDTKKAKAAMERTCKVCSPPQNLPNNQGWWLEFGLDKNPYIYGPMPRLRTGLRYLMEEARRMGWMVWVWHDEYEQDRKGVQPQLQATKTNNLKMQTYLDQLREQVRLKQLGLKEQKNQQQRGLPSIYDHLKTNQKDSKK